MIGPVWEPAFAAHQNVMQHRRIVTRLASALLFLASTATSQEPRILIGGEEDRGAILGRVVQVIALPQGLAILERSAPHLRYFDAQGRLRQTLGRSGAGPGEFRAPFSLSFDHTTGQLSVVDPQNARVTLYAVGDTLALRTTHQVDVPMIRAVCARGPRVVAIAGMDTYALKCRLHGGVALLSCWEVVGSKTEAV